MPMLFAPLALLGLAVWAAWAMSRPSSVNPAAAAGPTGGSPIGLRTFAPRNGAESLACSRLVKGEITLDDYIRIISVLRQ